jgi:hypothetical protein
LGAEEGAPRSVTLHLNVPNCDAFGHNWSFSTPLKATTAKERDDYVKKNFAAR